MLPSFPYSEDSDQDHRQPLTHAGTTDGINDTCNFVPGRLFDLIDVARNAAGKVMNLSKLSLSGLSAVVQRWGKR